MSEKGTIHVSLTAWKVLLFTIHPNFEIRVSQKGEMSKVGWLIGLVKHAVWAEQ
jgi:hypothetical protein